MPACELPWSQKLSEKDGTYTFTIIANERGDWDNQPLGRLLRHRIRDVEIVDVWDLHPVITDNFILVPLNKGLVPMKGNRGENIPIKGDFNKGDVFKIVFKAEHKHCPFGTAVCAKICLFCPVRVRKIDEYLIVSWHQVKCE